MEKYAQTILDAYIQELNQYFPLTKKTFFTKMPLQNSLRHMPALSRWLALCLRPVAQQPVAVQ
jgi:hypothetical protein